MVGGLLRGECSLVSTLLHDTNFKIKLTSMYVKLVEGTLEFSVQEGVEELCCILCT